jgi:type VII secretion-associated serine protease mycosin
VGTPTLTLRSVVTATGAALLALAPVAVSGPARAAPAMLVNQSAVVAARLAVCGPVVTEPLAESPWPLTRLRPDLAWPLSRGAGVIVAVIDSGVSGDHASLRDKVLPGLDMVPGGGGSGQCDESGHGTLVAGIIAGRDVVSAGFVFHGVAPDATILPIRVLRDEKRSFDEDLPARIATAVRWSVDNGHAGVINLSLTTTPTPSLADAIAYAIGKGVVVVAAAGNQTDPSQAGQPVYPAAYSDVIAVAGVDQQDEHVSTSDAGSYVDIAAPGVSIAGPAANGGGFVFTADGGTSFAAAYVSGVAALIRAYDPRLTPSQIAQRITSTADHPAQRWNSDVGYGVIDPARAVGSLPAAAAPPQGPQAIAVPPSAAQPDRTDAIVAVWVAVLGVTTVVVLLVSVPVVRRGRQRGWR